MRAKDALIGEQVNEISRIRRHLSVRELELAEVGKKREETERALEEKTALIKTQSDTIISLTQELETVRRDYESLQTSSSRALTIDGSHIFTLLTCNSYCLILKVQSINFHFLLDLKQHFSNQPAPISAVASASTEPTASASNTPRPAGSSNCGSRRVSCCYCFIFFLFIKNNKYNFKLNF